MTTFEQVHPRGNLTGGVPPERIKQALGWMEEEMPMEMVIGVNASIWLARVDSLNEMEENLSIEEFNKHLPDHRSALSILIAEGEQFVFLAKRSNLTKLPPGFTVADLEATLETLHIAFKCQHRPESNPKISAMIEGLLHGA